MKYLAYRSILSGLVNLVRQEVLAHLFILVLLVAIQANLVTVQGQYISKVWEYKPAPGQFINAAPVGLPHSAASIIGGIDGALSLGAFGGYVVYEQ